MTESLSQSGTHIQLADNRCGSGIEILHHFIRVATVVEATYIKGNCISIYA